MKRPVQKRLLLIFGAWVYASCTVTLTQGVTRVELQPATVERSGSGDDASPDASGDGCWKVSQVLEAYTRLQQPAYTWGVTGRYCVENGRILDDASSTLDVVATDTGYDYTNGEVETMPWGLNDRSVRFQAWGQFETCLLRVFRGGSSLTSLSVLVFADGRTPVSDAWT